MSLVTSTTADDDPPMHAEILEVLLISGLNLNGNLKRMCQGLLKKPTVLVFYNVLALADEKTPRSGFFMP